MQEFYTFKIISTNQFALDFNNVIQQSLQMEECLNCYLTHIPALRVMNVLIECLLPRTTAHSKWVLTFVLTSKISEWIDTNGAGVR